MMTVLSVNVSQPKEVSYRGETIRTGIFKAPVQGRVMMRWLNIDGDGQGNTAVHGGIDKAVYIYSIENYEHWKSELGRDNLTYGQFGENLTVEGMQEDTVHIGDVFRVGDGLVEVSQPRVPCAKLGMKMGTPEFIAPFLKSGRVGFYVRVLEESEVSATMPLSASKSGPNR